MDYKCDYVSLPKNYGLDAYLDRPDVKVIIQTVADNLSALEEKIHFLTLLKGKKVSYLPGLFYTYDSDAIEPTNNAIERLINRTKRHFKKWLGQQDISATFQNHGAKYALLSEFELGNPQITEILWERSVVFVEGINCTAESLTVTMNRDWQIRDHPTRTWEQLSVNVFQKNLQKCD